MNTLTLCESLHENDAQQIHLDRIKVPSSSSRIYKDECVLCYATAVPYP